MQKGFFIKRGAVVVSGLFVCLALTLSIVVPVHAQHIDIFTLDKFSNKNKRAEAPETGTVKVEDHYYYEVIVEKEKIDNGNILRTDIDLVELGPEDRGMYEWHQAEVLDEIDIVQKHVRVVGKLKCTRNRRGVIYWALNKVKYVAWNTWSSWDCSGGE